MIRAVIIEDEPDQLEGMKKLIEKYCPEVEVVGAAGEKTGAVEAILACQPDLVFLDIQLMGLPSAGFEVLEAVSFLDFELVFLSSHTEFALKAVNLQRPVCYFLEKPVQIEHAVLAVKKAAELLHLKTVAQANAPVKERLAVPKDGGLDLLWTREIVRCEADTWLTKVYLAGNKKMLPVSKNLGWFERQLSSDQFLRVHHSHIVNLQFISSYSTKEGGHLVLLNGDKIPVGPAYKEALLVVLHQL